MKLLRIPKSKEGNRYPDTGSTKDPKQDEPKQTLPRHTIIKMAKVKDNKRILFIFKERSWEEKNKESYTWEPPQAIS